ncbi:hypothetical protein BH24ACT3_BH24ACT3_09270 [soil metagenome]
MPPPHHHTRLAYQPALDGLRAVAVVAVMLYHGGVSWVPGGFLGVDLFFVLSGHLITTLLLREWAEDAGVDLRAFWVRRLRRLLPALLLVLAGVAVYAALWADPLTLQTLRWDGLSSLGYVANWRFVLSEASYFETFAEPSPLRHLWSLAVEEQWYLVWPLLVAGVLRLSRGRTAPLLVVAVALAAASAVWMAVLAGSGGDPSRAYYGTDTRAHTLLIGSVLAMVLHRHPIRSSSARHAAQGAGLAGAIICIAFFIGVHDLDGWLYQGGFAVLAVAATAVVAASVTAAPPGTGLLTRLLAVEPLRRIGLISYGLYLWHWPVNIVLNPERVGFDGPTLLAARTAAAVLLALASYRLIEMPVRLGVLVQWRARLATGTAVAVAVVLLIATTTLAPTSSTVETASATGPANAALEPILADREPPPPTTAPPARTTAAAPTTVTPPVTQPPVSVLGAVEPPPLPPPPDLPSPVPAGRDVRVMLVGDSVAWSLGYGLGEGRIDGIDLDSRGLLGCGIAGGVPYIGGRQNRREQAHCPPHEPVWRAGTELNPDVAVIWLGSWEVFDRQVGGERLRVGSHRYSRFLLRSLESGVDAIQEASPNTRVVVVRAPCMDERDFRLGGAESERNDPERVAAVNDIMERFITRNPEVALIDSQDFLCPGNDFRAELDGTEMRPDGLHFTVDSAVLTWNRWLGPEVRELVQSAG